MKRHAHLPDNLRRGRTMTSILAIRVPDDWATLESITNLFSAYGNITLGIYEQLFDSKFYMKLGNYTSEFII